MKKGQIRSVATATPRRAAVLGALMVDAAKTVLTLWTRRYRESITVGRFSVGSVPARHSAQIYPWPDAHAMATTQAVPHPYCPGQGLANPALLRIFWPVSPVTRATNFCASAALVDSLSTAIG